MTTFAGLDSRSGKGFPAARLAHEHAPQISQVQVQGRRQLAPHQGPHPLVHGQGGSGDQISSIASLAQL